MEPVRERVGLGLCHVFQDAAGTHPDIRNKGKGIDPSERPQMPTVDEKDVTAEEDVTAEDGGDGEQDPGADEYINDEDDEEDEDSEDDEDGENNDANPRKAIFCVSDIFSDYMLQN